MSLELYRYHNKARCDSSDTMRCFKKPKTNISLRKPCPVWIRGTKPDGTYVRESTGKRDWNEAEKYKSTIETTGEPPKATPKDSVEQLCDRFIKNMQTES
jgi:hypothetical protein